MIKQDSDGSFSLNMEYFTFHHSTENTYGSKFVELFGRERDPKSYFFTPDSGYPSYFGDKPVNYASLAQQNKHYADIAASIQRVTEEVLIRMANHLQEETGMIRLCMAGGVALNSVANGRILRETPFEEIYVQPAAGDGGGALGAALYAYHSVCNKPRNGAMKHAYWGKGYDVQEVDSFLKQNDIRHVRLDNENRLVERVADGVGSSKSEIRNPKLLR